MIRDAVDNLKAWYSREKRNTVKGKSWFTLYSLPHYLSGQLLRIMNEIKHS